MRKQWLGVAFFAGVVVGWVTFAEHGKRLRKDAMPDPRSVTFREGEELHVYQSRSPQTHNYRLMPFAMKRGDSLQTFGDAPADPDKLWLVSCNGAVISCRLESEK